MDNAIAFLKRKGPLGMPMAFWAGFGAIVLYLGWRWYKNRSGASSSSSATDTTGTDTTSPDTSTLTPAVPSGIDQSVPPDSTTPAPSDLQPATSTGPGLTLPTHPDTGTPKKDRPKHTPATHHDHKQGSHGTKQRHLPKPKSRNHHAPRTIKRPHSKEKAKVTANVPKHHAGTARHNPGTTAAPPAVHKVTTKNPPAAPHYEQPAKQTKAPPRKRTRN